MIGLADMAENLIRNGEKSDVTQGDMETELKRITAILGEHNIKPADLAVYVSNLIHNDPRYGIGLKILCGGLL